jgi:cellulose synthase/poly-beta-1,6-N-acetylglucosamine synthase-like glycosyltransferase
MDISSLIPEFLVLSLAGSSLSIAAYSSFKDRSDDQKLLLIIASCFIFAFLIVLILSAASLDNLSIYQYSLTLIFYALIYMAILSIIGFIIHRLRVDQKFKDDELQSAIDIIESSKDGLESSVSLFESENNK